MQLVHRVIFELRLHLSEISVSRDVIKETWNKLQHRDGMDWHEQRYEVKMRHACPHVYCHSDGGNGSNGASSSDRPVPEPETQAISCPQVLHAV